MLGDVKGQSAFRQVATPFIEVMRDLCEKVVHQIPEGDKVATRLTREGNAPRRLHGHAGNGRT